MNRREKKELDQWSGKLEESLRGLCEDTPVPDGATQPALQKKLKQDSDFESPRPSGRPWYRRKIWIPAMACALLLVVSVWGYTKLAAPVSNGFSGDMTANGAQASQEDAAEQTNRDTVLTVSDYGQLRNSVRQSQAQHGYQEYTYSRELAQYSRKDYSKSVEWRGFEFVFSENEGAQALQILDNTDLSLKSTVALPQGEYCGMLLWENKLILLEDSSSILRLDGTPYKPLSQAYTTIRVYSLEDPLQPVLENSFTQSGWLKDIKIEEGQLYLATHWDIPARLYEDSPVSTYVPHTQFNEEAAAPVEETHLKLLPEQAAYTYAVYSTLSLEAPEKSPETQAVLGNIDGCFLGNKTLYFLTETRGSTSNENSVLVAVSADSAQPVLTQPLGAVVFGPGWFVQAPNGSVRLCAGIDFEDGVTAGLWSFQEDFSGWEQRLISQPGYLREVTFSPDASQAALRFEEEPSVVTASFEYFGGITVSEALPTEGSKVMRVHLLRGGKLALFYSRRQNQEQKLVTELWDLYTESPQRIGTAQADIHMGVDWSGSSFGIPAVQETSQGLAVLVNRQYLQDAYSLLEEPTTQTELFVFDTDAQGICCRGSIVQAQGETACAIWDWRLFGGGADTYSKTMAQRHTADGETIRTIFFE